MPIILQESSGACGDDRIQGINTGFVAGELSLVLYRPTGVYEL